jgi:hypothetical protein
VRKAFRARRPIWGIPIKHTAENPADRGAKYVRIWRY